MRQEARGVVVVAGSSPEETRRVLGLLQESLDEARSGGEGVLKLGPDDLRGLLSRAGVEGEAARVLRSLVRSNLIRLRGRWREGISGETAPVYVARVAAPEPQGTRDDEGPAGVRHEERAASSRSEGGGS